MDIVNLEDALETIITRYRDATLNDLPEFDGLNPSIEHFSRIVHSALTDSLSVESLDGITVRIWEDDEAWAAYSQ